MGYVYILTNPSFREDWVKIGKTEREVNVRSKELDNTAVPLPFEIYATIKTEKYNELEKAVHDILTDLTDKRIRPNREFFKIKPEDAFKHLKQLASLIEDAEINAPDDYDEEEASSKSSISRPKKGDYHVNYDGIFYLKPDSEIYNAKMRVDGGNKYILLEGSIIDPGVYTNVNTVNSLRKKYKDYLSGDVVIKDIEYFNKPSTVGEFVRGRAVNGKMYWQTKNEEPLEKFIVYDE